MIGVLHPDFPVNPSIGTSGQTIASRFRQVALSDPEAAAVVEHDDPVTYHELLLRVNSLAICAAATGVGPGAVVGLLARHGTESVAGILGILETGSTFVVLDPRWPAARLAQIVDEARPVAVVHGSGLGDLAVRSLAGLPTPPTLIDMGDLCRGIPVHDRQPRMSPPCAAYLAYTSGSTGRPKGVFQSHEAVLRCVDNQRRTLELGPGKRLSLLSSFAYDMGLVDLFSAVLTGAALVPVDAAGLGLADVWDGLDDAGATLLHTSPTVLRSLLESAPEQPPDHLRGVLLGGEAVTGADIKRIRLLLGHHLSIVVGYGCTEASFAMHEVIGPGRAVPDGPLPLGRKLPGYAIRLIDDQGREVVEGEIELRSAAVALGYTGSGDPSRFHEHHDDTRSYRTGDHARRGPDGDLHFLGRQDRQLKVRGYRVEPAEIEARLEALPGVRRALVGLADHGQGDELAAYLETDSCSEAEAAWVRAQLAEVLPRHLVPSAVHLVSALPRTVTGKLDRRFLNPRERDASTHEPPRPAQSVEDHVAGCFATALGVSEVDRRVGFFELGGHSLQLATVHADLSRSYDGLRLADVLSYPTVAGLAAHLQGGTSRTRTPAARARTRTSRARATARRR